MTYTLYYAPGACSIAPSIALRETQLPFEMVKIDLRAKRTAAGDDYLAINPKGYVPALRVPGGAVLTEVVAIVQYIADHDLDAQLAPGYGMMSRYRLMEWLNFISTELHKATSPLYNPAATDDFKKSLKDRLALRWAVLAEGVRRSPYLIDERFTVADGYAFYVLRSWQRVFKEDLARWPALVDYYTLLTTRSSIKAALEAEGLQP